LEDKSAILVGASGLVGGELLNFLLQGEQYSKVIVLGRRPLNITHPKLEEIIVDFEYLDEYKESFSVDDVFCCLGTTIKKAKTKEGFKKVDVDYVLSLARIAKEMKVEKFLIVSSMGANQGSAIFYSKMKGLVEESLKKIGFNSLHIFRPSLLLGKRQEVRSGEAAASVLSQLLLFMFRGPLRKYRPIDAKVVAKGMYRAAQKERDGHYIYMSDEIFNLS